MAFPNIGEPAPEFTLPDAAGAPVSLRDFRGASNVALYFYPRAMTPGCTVQARGIRDREAELRGANTAALGISPDPAARLAKFIGKEALNFTLLADEDHAVAERYGCWGLKKFMGKEFMGILRTTFIIDREGVLRHIIEKVKTKTHHDDVLALVRELGLA